MPTSKYYREQAKILTSLALSTRDAVKAKQFDIAAMEHLARAKAMEDSAIGPSRAKAPGTDQSGDRA
jgi:hypothetical protein